MKISDFNITNYRRSDVKSNSAIVFYLNGDYVFIQNYNIAHCKNCEVYIIFQNSKFLKL